MMQLNMHIACVLYLSRMTDSLPFIAKKIDSENLGTCPSHRASKLWLQEQISCLLVSCALSLKLHLLQFFINIHLLLAGERIQHLHFTEEQIDSKMQLDPSALTPQKPHKQPTELPGMSNPKAVTEFCFLAVLSYKALRDKRSRNPNEERQRVLLGNQQTEQRVSPDTGREHSPGRASSPNSALLHRISFAHLMGVIIIFLSSNICS